MTLAVAASYTSAVSGRITLPPKPFLAALVAVLFISACRFGDFSPDAGIIDAALPDASADAALPDAMLDAAPIDALPDAAADAMPPADAVPPDAYEGEHPIGELASGLSTLVGSSGPGHFDGDRAVSLFNNPVNVAVGPSGDIYVADFNNDAIRVITPAGDTTTLVDQSDFSRPFGMTFTATGDLYAQTDRNSLGEDLGAFWKVDTVTGEATLLADNVGRIRGLACLSDGRLVVSSVQAHTIQLFDPETQSFSLIAGEAGTSGFVNGAGAQARFKQPLDVVVTSADNIYVADSGNNRIRHVTLAGAVATVAGNGDHASVDGNALVASFERPVGLALQNDSTLYISEFSSGKIRKLHAGAITTVAGSTQGFSDSTDALTGQLYSNEGIDLALPYLYITDGNGGSDALYHRVRRFRAQ